MHGDASLLLVDDDALLARSLARELSQHNWRVRVADSGAAALALLRAEPSDVVVVDLRLPDLDGMALIEQLRALDAGVPLFLLSGHLDVASAVRAVRLGAEDVLEKPIAGAALDVRLRAAVSAGVRARRSEPPSVLRVESSLIMGDAPCIRAVREQVRTVARFRDLSVLITGETGTGKELVAQSVHAASGTDGPFVPVNCAAIPDTLFESELFGHEAGAFTGARGVRTGLFEHAADGTLFLDEIGELPEALQPKLLRALESRTFRRVGGTRDIPFRARVISATHRTLIGSDARVRSDVYYRLSGFTIATPALRDHPSDIDMLARHFLSEFATRYEVEISFSPRALEALHAYDWPGNVRELRAVVQQAAVLSGGGRVGVAELAAALRDRQQRPRASSAVVERVAAVESARASIERSSILPSEPLRVLERRTIEENWNSSGHNLSAAARALGLPRTTLRDRLKKYGLR